MRFKAADHELLGSQLVTESHFRNDHSQRVSAVPGGLAQMRVLAKFVNDVESLKLVVAAPVDVPAAAVPRRNRFAGHWGHSICPDGNESCGATAASAAAASAEVASPASASPAAYQNGRGKTSSVEL